MARKKQEVALQIDIESQEDMDEMLNKDGLIVMDVYQEWSGPCKAMVSIFRKIKNEIGDELLRFAMAKCDTVDSLERYRGRCEPCFLFFAGGVLVNVIRGSNSPLINKVIMEQLAYEHKVLDGSAERKEIRDPLLADFDDRGAFDEEDEDEDGEGVQYNGERIHFDSLPELAETDEEGSKRGVTLAIIKPNVVAEGKAEEVMEKMKEAGIEILEHTERQLTEEEARSFYSDKEGEEFYEDLVKFMSSGPSHVLVLSKGETGEGIVEEWRELLGPPSVEEAKEKAPDSLRAKYGKESYANALHGSDSQARAMAELAFFFPNYTVPTVPRGKKPHVQRTLALIRPDALREKKEEIMAKVKEAGFQIAMQKEMQLTKEQAEAFYSEHKGESYFDTLTTRMSSGPVLALALARDDAITGWRDLLGPKDVKEAQESAPDSLRAQFSHTDDPVNALHGSDSPSTAENELNFFFPMQQTVAVIKPEAYESKDAIIDRIKEAGFHVAARKETELTADIAEQFYKGVEGKEFYGDLVKHMTSGQTLFMVLSREDAVDGWRSLIGPTDPEKAKEEAPESLRAQFGKDTLANAVHGSSSAEQAAENIKILFAGDSVGEDSAAQDGDDNGKEASSDSEPTALTPAVEEVKSAEENEEATQEEKAAKEEGRTGVAQSQAKEEGDDAAKAESESDLTHGGEKVYLANESGEAGEVTTTGEDKPTTSAAGSKPTTPAAGSKPTTPAAGSKPTTPAAGSKPTTPAAGSKPTTPAAGSKPTTPAAGSKPTTPAAGSISATPEGESKPASPTTAGNPATPAAESKPATPAVGSKPTTPAVESTPVTPAVGSKPSSPAPAEDEKKDEEAEGEQKEN